MQRQNQRTVGVMTDLYIMFHSVLLAFIHVGTDLDAAEPLLFSLLKTLGACAAYQRHKYNQHIELTTSLK